MEAEITQHLPEKKQSLWSLGQILFASYLAGPIAGCYLLGRNYKVLGKPEHSKKCYIAGFIGTILLSVALSFIPEDLIEKIPRIIIPVTYSLLIKELARVYQGKIIEEKMKEGSKRYSHFWCFLVTSSLLVIQLLFLFLFLFLCVSISDAYFFPSIDT